MATVSGCCSSARPNFYSRDEAAWCDLIKKIARVSVLIIGVAYMPVATAIGFAAGVVLGALGTIYYPDKLKKGDLMQLCILGYSEFTSDTKFPVLFNTGLTAVFLLDCMAHGSSLFGGCMSMGVGFWVGKEITLYEKSHNLLKFS